ncbi:MAG: hypothetical protein ACRDPC_10245 [Solirubrobacteraceae bacterium]
MDLGGVEDAGFRAAGGADTIVVGDLTGTEAGGVDLDLGSFGDADGQVDTVIANGTNDRVEVRTLDAADTVRTGVALSGPAGITIDGGGAADLVVTGTARRDASGSRARGRRSSRRACRPARGSPAPSGPRTGWSSRRSRATTAVTFESPCR